MPSPDVSPLSASASTLLDALSGRVGSAPHIGDWLAALMAEGRQEATVEAAVRDRLARGGETSALSRDQVVELAGRHAAQQGHPVVTTADLVASLLDTEPKLATTTQPAAMTARQPVQAPGAPLSVTAERLLSALYDGAAAAAPSELLAALLAQHRDAVPTEVLPDALAAASSGRAAGAVVARDVLVAEAGRIAVARHPGVATSEDVAAAVVAAARAGQEPAPTREQSNRAKPRTPRKASRKRKTPPTSRPVEVAAQAAQRSVRVFVSSTFRDMQAERDELVKRTFPKLRRLCESRDVTWGEVDLRWGITDEQKAEGKVLPICLEEIRNCRPYFIGLLGERYGWVPDEVDADVVERHPWIAGCPDASVTELEIRHGALNDPAEAADAFLYFRSPKYVDGLPSEERALCLEPDPDRRQRLADLKDRIRTSGLPVRENYPDAETLGQLVLDDLTAVIERDFPEGSQPDWLDREMAEHLLFARSRAHVYVARDEYFRQLDAHEAGEGPPLVLLGESGSGKSALLANWVLRHDPAAGPTPIVHFVGATPLSADWTVLVRRIIGELGRRLDLALDVPDATEALRAAFASALHKAAARGRVVLVIDALNQLEDRDGAPDLVWLPTGIPANVRLVLSTLPGRPLDELHRRGWPTLNVEPLTADERTRLIVDYLAPRRLSADRVTRLTASEQTANPLYLRSLLEELRVWGDHFRLDEQIDRCLAATTTRELFGTILRRYELDYERDRPGLVGEAMSLVWAARRGISETELLDILGRAGTPLPRALWSPLYLAAEQSLASRSGLITFSHDYLRTAVAETYLPGEDEKRAVHRRIADYFEAQPLGPRKLTELAWQLSRAGSWQRLYDLLSDQEFLSHAWEADRFDVRARWAEVEACSPLRMVDAYQPVVDDPARFPNATVWRVQRLLDDAGHPDASMALVRSQKESARASGRRDLLQRALWDEGVMLFEQGDLDGAMGCYQEQEAIARELGDEAALLSLLGNQANILWRRGEHDAAMTLHKQEEQLARKRNDRDALQRCLGNQANILLEQGDLDAAYALHREEEHICRELGDPEALQGALSNLGTVLLERGDLDGAMALFVEKETICREIGYRAGLARALGNQAAVQLKRGDVDAALAQLEEQAGICREIHDKPDLVVALGAQATILRELGDIDGALARYDEQAAVCREVNDRRGTAQALGHRALLLQDRGDLDEAIEAYWEQEALCRELGDADELQGAINNQAVALKRRGDFDAAMALQEEVERICRSRDDRPGTARSLANQGLIVMHQGDTERAMALLRQSEQISRDLDDHESVARTLVNEASVQHHADRVDEAERLMGQAHTIAADHGLDDLAQLIERELHKLGSSTDRVGSDDLETPVGVTAPTRLDLALKSPNGDVVLGIVATGDWRADPRLVPALRAKLEAHVAFARSRECVEKLGAAATRILLMTTYEPTEEVTALLHEVSALSGIPIDVERAADMPQVLRS